MGRFSALEQEPVLLKTFKNLSTGIHHSSPWNRTCNSSRLLLLLLALVWNCILRDTASLFSNLSCMFFSGWPGALRVTGMAMWTPRGIAQCEAWEENEGPSKHFFDSNLREFILTLKKHQTWWFYFSCLQVLHSWIRSTADIKSMNIEVFLIRSLIGTSYPLNFLAQSNPISTTIYALELKDFSRAMNFSVFHMSLKPQPSWNDSLLIRHFHMSHLSC